MRQSGLRAIRTNILSLLVLSHINSYCQFVFLFALEIDEYTVLPSTAETRTNSVVILLIICLWMESGWE
jgi:hypothetical protein